MVSSVKYLGSLAKLKEIQNSIQDVHQLFRLSYPITIVEDSMFNIYDVPPECDEYELMKSPPCPFQIPDGVRAAFPMECYDNHMSAVVTGEVFDTKEGYTTILHEFVHCAQFNECEIELKESLSISQRYKKENNHMWEIMHPFPYYDEAFIDLFAQYMDALDEFDFQRARMERIRFMNIMSKIDLEYFIWQEWKEGFSRFLENEIKTQLGMKTNCNGREQPYSRVSFYESGSAYISMINSNNRDAVADMKNLFFEMNKEMLSDIE